MKLTKFLVDPFLQYFLCLGISLKLQEEERERRLDFVPEVSALEQETIQIDPDTRDMLETLGFGSLNGVAVNQAHRD